jgi:Arc/MetJ-type ribon-helix-helix transcriptional regulator
MATVTISLPSQVAKQIDSETKKQGFATRSEFIRSLIRKYFSLPAEELKFEPFVPKPLEEIRADFEKTGKYNKKFIDSLMKGLAQSTIYAGKTIKK